MNSKTTIGTVIHGTLRDEDLLEAFTAELERVGSATWVHDKLTEYGMGIGESFGQFADREPEASSELVNEILPDALNEYAPPHVYFGALEGDGADFGWWPDTGSFPDCEVHYVNEPNSWVDLTCEVFVTVNDHGNVTVSELRGPEIWSAV